MKKSTEARPLPLPPPTQLYHPFTCPRSELSIYNQSELQLKNLLFFSIDYLNSTETCGLCGRGLSKWFPCFYRSWERVFAFKLD